MHDVLIITPHFPSPDYYRERSRDPRTKFLYDYAASWVGQGHRVVVVHLPPRYPALFNMLATATGHWPFMRNLRLNRYVQDHRAIQPADYDHAGIHVVRQPMAKHWPHRDYARGTLAALKQQLVALAERGALKADIILADYLSPSLVLANALSGVLKATVFPIMHQTDLRYFRRCGERFLPSLQTAGAVLFRSAGMVRRFERAGLVDIRALLMYSGIPDATMRGTPRTTRIKRLLYVGTLRRTKNVHHTLRAMADLRVRHPSAELDVVGDGEYGPELKMQAQRLGLAERVHFIGTRSREQVFEHMRKADLLVMVSKESFGMVYIEAMSQGCPVVAAQGEGIDGIVRDGDNGYLVPLDNEGALTEALDALLALSPGQVERISKRAIETADGLRNDVLARDVAGNLVSLHKAKTVGGPGRTVKEAAP